MSGTHDKQFKNLQESLEESHSSLKLLHSQIENFKDSTMDSFEDSQLGSLEEETKMATSLEAFVVQLPRILRQLDSTVAKVSDIQIELAKLSNQQMHLQQSLDASHNNNAEDYKVLEMEVTKNRIRIEKVESFVWKFSGGLTVAVFALQLYLNHFKG